MQTNSTTQTPTKSRLTKTLLSKSVSESFLNRNENIDDYIELLIEHYEYNLSDRRPGPAILVNGDVKASDMDLACIAAVLAKRRAAIVLPDYQGSGGGNSAPGGQVRVGGSTRFGQLVGLQSNEEYFSFNGKFVDHGIINTATAGGTIGAMRDFHFVGKDGRWHPGYNGIQFAPDANENNFFQTFGINAGTDLKFDRFVADGREWNFFSQYNYLVQIAIQRLEEERSALNAFVKEKKPKSGGSTWQKDDDRSSTHFKKRSMDVPVFTSAIEVPWTGDDYTVDSVKRESKDWEVAEARSKKIQYDFLPSLRFAARVTEYAFYKKGAYKIGFPAWMKNGKWATTQVKRTKFLEVKENFLTGFSAVPLRYRVRAKSIEVEVK